MKYHLTRALFVALISFFVGLSGCVSNAPKSGDATSSNAGGTPATIRSSGSLEKSQPGATAYKLQDCKPVEGWNIVDGGCAGFGKFQGEGTGVRNSIMFIGNFENGMPQGKGRMCFRYADREQERTYNKKASCGRELACSVEFRAGKIHGTEMVCQMGGDKNMWGKRKSGLEIALHSPSGFFIDDGALQARGFGDNKVSTISTDQARVEINGEVVYSPLRLGNLTDTASAIGELRQIVMKSGDFSFDRFSGTITVPANAKNNSELKVKGVFRGKIHGTSASFSPYPFSTPNGRDITKESLVELSYAGKSYALVFDSEVGSSKSAVLGSVIYYKDSSGVEFDGTYAGCAGKLPLKRFGVANLRTITRANDGAFQGYEINPLCGTITTPSGSYSGMFRNGRPE